MTAFVKFLLANELFLCLLLIIAGGIITWFIPASFTFRLGVSILSISTGLIAGTRCLYILKEVRRGEDSEEEDDA